MSASGLSEMSCWPPASAWLTWWNKYGNLAVGVWQGKRWGVDDELRDFVQAVAHVERLES